MTPSSALNSIERPTLSAQVARHLLALINTEQLRAGDAVPSEMRICQELQISRGSVREAYRALAALGILEIEGGRRPRLRVIDASVLAQVFDYALNTAQVSLAHVLETRRAIELQTAQLAARYADDAQRQRLRELVTQMRTAGQDHARRIAADSAIHHVIAAASGNPLHALLLGALGTPVDASAHLHLAETRPESELLRVIDAHEAVVDRICAGDPMGAQSAMSYHFDLALVNVQRQGDRNAAESGTGPGAGRTIVFAT
jgi:GntR family transcriptional repressor for pyruvate dehydrogenase complex